MQRIVLPKGFEVREILIFSETEALYLGEDGQMSGDIWFYFNPTDGTGVSDQRGINGKAD